MYRQTLKMVKHVAVVTLLMISMLLITVMVTVPSLAFLIYLVFSGNH
jgi:hypothetical protein